jgi:ketosteroid isomerase-like protein
MRKIIFLLVVCCLPVLLPAQDKDKQTILDILERQTNDWNRGNLDSFMVGYWNNDSLMFIGQSGITYGYQKTLANYKRNYSDTVQMGKLSFNILQVKKLSPEYYFVVGKWLLRRSIGNLEGHYTLVFRKINGQWVIVADHSS